jgi:hypothetical protein
MPSSVCLSTHEPLVRAARQRSKDAARICCSLHAGKVLVDFAGSIQHIDPAGECVRVFMPSPEE